MPIISSSIPFDYFFVDPGSFWNLNADLLKGSIHPFGEFRFTVGNGSTAMIAAGLNFTLRQ